MNTNVASLLNSSASEPLMVHDWPSEARRIVRMLGQLRHGSLTVQWPDNQVQAFGDPEGNIHASLHLRNWKPLAQALKSGDIGFAKATWRVTGAPPT